MTRPLALLLLAACGPTSDDADLPTTCTPTMPSLAWEDVPSGYHATEATYAVPWSGEDRTIPVNLWYPTDATSGTGLEVMGLFDDPKSLVDAPFADRTPACKLPLLVYSHGSQGWGTNSSIWHRFFASQGWVFAAPEHLGNTLTDNLDPRPVSFSLTRVHDVAAAIDAVDALPEDHPLYGRVDTEHVIVTGHSFGGETAWLYSGPTMDTEAIAARCDAGPPGCTPEERAAFEDRVDDPRVVAVIGLDGSPGTGIVADEGWATADRPILHLSQVAGGPDTFDRALVADIIWAQVEGSCHESFTATELRCDSLPKDEGMRINTEFIGAFAARHLLGLEDGAGVLDGSDTVSDRVILKRTR